MAYFYFKKSVKWVQGMLLMCSEWGISRLVVCLIQSERSSKRGNKQPFTEQIENNTTPWLKHSDPLSVTDLIFIFYRKSSCYSFLHTTKKKKNIQGNYFYILNTLHRNLICQRPFANWKEIFVFTWSKVIYIVPLRSSTPTVCSHQERQNCKLIHSVWTRVTKATKSTNNNIWATRAAKRS